MIQAGGNMQLVERCNPPKVSSPRESPPGLADAAAPFGVPTHTSAASKTTLRWNFIKCVLGISSGADGQQYSQPIWTAGKQRLPSRATAHCDVPSPMRKFAGFDAGVAVAAPGRGHEMPCGEASAVTVRCSPDSRRTHLGTAKTDRGRRIPGGELATAIGHQEIYRGHLCLSCAAAVHLD